MNRLNHFRKKEWDRLNYISFINPSYLSSSENEVIIFLHYNYLSAKQFSSLRESLQTIADSRPKSIVPNRSLEKEAEVITKPNLPLRTYEQKADSIQLVVVKNTVCKRAVRHTKLDVLKGLFHGRNLMIRCMETDLISVLDLIQAYKDIFLLAVVVHSYGAKAADNKVDVYKPCYVTNHKSSVDQTNRKVETKKRAVKTNIYSPLAFSEMKRPGLEVRSRSSSTSNEIITSDSSSQAKEEFAMRYARNYRKFFNSYSRAASLQLSSKDSSLNSINTLGVRALTLALKSATALLPQTLASRTINS